MKIQDILFGAVLFVLLVLKKEKALVIAGLLFLLGAMVLFSRWVFFTGERFVWYAACLFSLVVLKESVSVYKKRSM